MEFAFTEEQQMIRESAESFLKDVSTSEAIRKAMVTEQGFEQSVWQSISNELYLQAITIPEEFGGLGLGFVELVAVMEQMGRYLLCAPFFSTTCLATTALQITASKQQQTDYFARILAGETATLALTSDGQYEAASVQVTYRKEAENYIINGDYRYVIDGHTADFLILVAREEGSTGEEGIAFFVTERTSESITVTGLPTMDQTRKQAGVQIRDLTLPESQLMADNAADQLAKVINLASITLAAEQVGGAQQVLDLTVDYTRERVQFNRPIASFQAVKHTAANMMTKVEAARSCIYYAACIAEEAFRAQPMGAELAEAASIAKSTCSDAYFENASDAIQLHGGVGFTWEYDIHLYFKRARASAQFLGTASDHRERLASMLLD